MLPCYSLLPYARSISGAESRSRNRLGDQYSSLPASALASLIGRYRARPAFIGRSYDPASQPSLLPCSELGICLADSDTVDVRGGRETVMYPLLASSATDTDVISKRICFRIGVLLPPGPLISWTIASVGRALQKQKHTKDRYLASLIQLLSSTTDDITPDVGLPSFSRLIPSLVPTEHTSLHENEAEQYVELVGLHSTEDHRKWK